MTARERQRYEPNHCRPRPADAYFPFLPFLLFLPFFATRITLFRSHEQVNESLTKRQHIIDLSELSTTL